MLSARISTDIRIHKDAVPERMLAALVKRMTYRNPARKEAERAGLEHAEHMPDTWCALKEDAGWIVIPRGAWRAVRDSAHEAGVQIDWESGVKTHEARPVPAEDLGRQPRPYQAEGIRLLHERVQGVIQLPCGGGKTVLGSVAALTLGQPALVLVHMTDLQEQWAATFEAQTGDAPRLLGGGHGWDLSPLRPGEMAVATVQTLYACPEDQVIAFLESVGVVIVDECHRVKIKAMSWVLERCPARYRWGLSATPERPDGWGMILDLLIGPVVFKMTAHELIDLGFLVAPVVIPVDTGWEPGGAEYSWSVQCDECKRPNRRVPWGAWKRGEAACRCWVICAEGGKRKRRRCGALLREDADSEREQLAWGTALTSLTMDPGRIRLIESLGLAAYRAGRRTLILVARKRVLARLERGLSQDGCRAGAVSSASGKGSRGQSIEDLKTGRLDVLIATKLAEEGLDVPALDCTIVAEPGKAKGRTKQIGGRGCRPAGDWQPLIFEMVDGGKTFRRHWAARRAAYRSEYGPGCIASDRPLSLDEALQVLGEARTLAEVMK